MLTYKNNSDTVVIVVHEIYGINNHMKSFCEKISGQGIDVFCPNLLARKPFSYDQEDLAYKYFFDNIGFQDASSQVIDLLRIIGDQYRCVYIIGFSVGATIAWLCCAEQGLCDAVIGFYGSRIRDFLNIEPNNPVLLFFPSSEKSFDVSLLVSSLNKKALVDAKIYPAKHGFADPYSEKYSEQSANEAAKEMIVFLSNIRCEECNCS